MRSVGATSSRTRRGVEGAGVADERDEHGKDAQQPGAVVAHVEVGGNASFYLGVAAAEGGEHGAGEQLAGWHVDSGAGQVVTEAVAGQVALQVLFFVGLAVSAILETRWMW